MKIKTQTPFMNMKHKQYQKLFLKSRPYHLSLLNPDYDLSYLDNDFKISISNFAGTAILTLIVDSINILDDNDVSRSDEVIMRSLSFISNKKLSNIGKVLLVFNIDPKICKFLNSSEDEIINFIFFKDIVNEEKYKIYLLTF